jgi:hypothetical protein
MAAVLLVRALSSQSEEFCTGQEALLEAVRCSKAGDHTKISEILTFLKTSYDLSLARSFPNEVYMLLKTASKVVDSDVQKILRSSSSLALAMQFEAAAGAVNPKQSFSVADGEGGEIRINSTAIRLFFPELMLAAKNFFKGHATPAEAPSAEPTQSVEPPVKRPRGGQDPLPVPKYTITKDFFPFLERRALKGLLVVCGGQKPTPPLSMREALQALAAAKMAESLDPHSENAVSKIVFRMVDDFLVLQDPEKLCSIPNDGLALLAYAIAASKALIDGDHDREASHGVPDTGSEEMNGMLAPFACLTRDQVGSLIAHYQQHAALTPERMVDLCRNKIFFAAICQCKELRRITVFKRISNEIAVILMMQNEKLRGLSWEIREIRREGLQRFEKIVHVDPAK